MGDDGPGHGFVMTPHPDLDRVQLPLHIMGHSPLTMMFRGLIGNGTASYVAYTCPCMLEGISRLPQMPNTMYLPCK